jgi:hypothetical protein
MIETGWIWAERKRMHAYLRTFSLSPSSLLYASTFYTRFVAVMSLFVDG